MAVSERMLDQAQACAAFSMTTIAPMSSGVSLLTDSKRRRLFASMRASETREGTNVDRLDEARRIIADAIREHQPTAACALFSGGHDSLATAHVAMQVPGVMGAAHIDTGTGIAETRQFVHETAERQGWHLREYRTPPQVYRDMVLRSGFPGPSAHRYCYIMLKERRLADMKREVAFRKPIMLITGVRRQESVRRMGHVDPVRRVGQWIWVAPLVNWSSMDVRDYVTDAGLPSNPVVDLLHMSGECRCGAYAKTGELDEQEAWFPGSTAWIRALEREAAIRDLPARWGRPPSRYHVERKRGQLVLPLCSSCEARFMAQ